MKYQAPRGTHDILPNEAVVWRDLEGYFRHVVGLYGYGEVRTPAFEDTELFKRTSGETSDIVTKQMYEFTDKGGRSITLKAEGTAPAVRAYLEHGLGGQGQTTRLWYQTPVFRYERPQKGRYRQHHQFGIECLGSASPQADAEVIEVAYRFLNMIGISDVKVSVNSIGREATRSSYRQAVLSHAAGYLADLEADERARAEKNPLRLLDSKDPKAIEVMKAAPSILDYLEDESRMRFDTLCGILADIDIPFEVRPEIVRGLDYYTDTVFEVLSDQLGAQSALCGGGRYDGLVRALGGPDTPAVGFGMGIERLALVLESLRFNSGESIQAYVVAATESARSEVSRICRLLRSKDVSAQCDVDGKDLRRQMKQADAMKAEAAVIIGDDELASGNATVRYLESGDQRAVPFSELASHIGRLYD
ncbi:MAG: histidine--tRNA ligase [Chthonomonas sp.]|nr:histidine--tRNA ligase [Chthonomonas sp.]